MRMNSNFSKNQSVNKKNDQLDLIYLLKLFQRNKKLISIFVFLSTLLTVLYVTFAKPIWRGSFNIVVREENENKFKYGGLGGTDVLSSILSSEDSSRTQELILQSPSVISPVYEFVKEYYASKNIDTKNMDFDSWLKEELEIKFQKNTSVLTIIHKNSDKDLIKKTLNLIVEKYKAYSKKDREENITRTINYLKDQKKLLSDKALVSQKEFNSFSIKNGLGDLDGFVGLDDNQKSFNNSLQSILGNSNTNVQGLRQFNSNVNSLDSGDAGQRFKNQFNLLESYEAKYTDLSSKLKPTSIYLKNLKVKIDHLRNSLKRPNEILIKYKELRRLASRDLELLSDVEDNLELIKLEKIKLPLPWQMISTPTIDKKRVFPEKKKITIVMFIFSIFGGFGVAYLVEKKKGIIYDFDEIKTNLNCNYLETIYKSSPNLSIQLLESIANKNKSKIAILNINNNLDLDFIGESNFKVIDLKDKDAFQKCESIIPIIEQGKISTKELLILNKYISIYRDKIKDWILLDSNLNLI